MDGDKVHYDHFDKKHCCHLAAAAAASIVAVEANVAADRRMNENCHSASESKSFRRRREDGLYAIRISCECIFIY